MMTAKEAKNKSDGFQNNLFGEISAMIEDKIKTASDNGLYSTELKIQTYLNLKDFIESYLKSFGYFVKFITKQAGLNGIRVMNYIL